MPSRIQDGSPDVGQYPGDDSVGKTGSKTTTSPQQTYSVPPPSPGTPQGAPGASVFTLDAPLPLPMAAIQMTVTTLSNDAMSGKMTLNKEEIKSNLSVQKKENNDRLQKILDAWKQVSKAAKSGVFAKAFGWAGAALSIVAGAALVATGVGAVAGGLLIAAGTVGMINMAMQQFGGYDKLAKAIGGKLGKKIANGLMWGMVGLQMALAIASCGVGLYASSATFASAVDAVGSAISSAGSAVAGAVSGAATAAAMTAEVTEEAVQVAEITEEAAEAAEDAEDAAEAAEDADDADDASDDKGKSDTGKDGSRYTKLAKTIHTGATLGQALTQTGEGVATIYQGDAESQEDTDYSDADYIESAITKLKGEEKHFEDSFNQTMDDLQDVFKQTFSLLNSSAQTTDQIFQGQSV